MLRSALVIVAALLSISTARPHAIAGDASSREDAVRARGRFFSKIAVDKNYSGEWVIARTKKATAFLDIMDPRHPRTRAKGDEVGKAIHILVVPNQAREHIAKSLGGTITEADVRAALDVFVAARKLAKRLGIKGAKIYCNSESRIDVGYLHVHIRGELPTGKKLPRLAK